MDEKKTITPSEYFTQIKEAKNTITLKDLKNSFEVFVSLAEKYKKLGQVESLKKLNFLAQTMKAEEKLIEMGITTYIYRDTIENYIDTVADKAVKIIELSRYTREIPDDLVEVIEKVKPLFSELYVIFTDYTGKTERQVAKERRDKDPILFGVFKTNTLVSDRFYFLGDWVDEYCDLTLDKMIEEYRGKKKVKPTNEIVLPSTTDELVDILKNYQPKESKDEQSMVFHTVTPTETSKKGFFSKVRSFLGL